MKLRKKSLQKIFFLVIAGIIFLFMLYCDWNKITVKVFGLSDEYSDCYFDNIILCGNNSDLQKVRLYEKQEKEYYVFMPAEMRTEVYVTFSGFHELQIGDVVYRDGDELTDIYKNEPYKLIAFSDNGEAIEEATVKFYFCIDVPSVYIETESGSTSAINADKEVKETALLASVTELGENDAYTKCRIRARGNTSFSYDPKSYSINLNSEESILGLEASSKWALLANYGESIQQLKNKIALDIAEITQMEYTPESRYVNLYINEQYNGIYLLTQRISAEGGSVHLQESKNENRDATSSFLLEFDARYDTEPIWFKTDNKSVVVKYPQSLSEEGLKTISEYVKEAEAAIFSDDGVNPVTKKRYTDYIDLESWAKMYLIQEFFVQHDVEFASFYLYKNSGDEKIYAGPIWDFDLTFGKLFQGYYPTMTQKTMWIKDYSGGWLGKLAQYPEMDALIKEQYVNYFSPAVRKYLSKSIEVEAKTIDSSVYMNGKRWDLGDPDVKADAEILCRWMEKRIDFLDEYMINEEAFSKVSFHFGWGTISHYVKTGESLGFLPCEEYGEHDYLYDKEHGYGTIIGWQDEVGNEIDDEIIIKYNRDFYPIYLEESSP